MDLKIFCVSCDAWSWHFDTSNVQPTGNSEVDSARGEALLLAQAVEVEVIVTPRRDEECSGIWDVGVVGRCLKFLA